MAFFSGTDMNDLHENAEGYPFLLSLIVNFKDGGNPVAKIAFTGEDSFSERVISTNPRLKNLNLSLGKENTSKKVLVICDCIVEYQIPEVVKNRLITLGETQKKAEEVKRTSIIPTHNPYSRSNQLGFDWDGPYENSTSAWDKLKNKLSEKSKKKKNVKDLKNSNLDLTETNLKTFLIGVVNCDPLCTDVDLFITLKRLDNNSELQDETTKSIWLDQIEENIESWALSYFGVLSTNEQNIIFDKCESILRSYKTCNFASDIADVMWSCITNDPINYGRNN